MKFKNFRSLGWHLAPPLREIRHSIVTSIQNNKLDSFEANRLNMIKILFAGVLVVFRCFQHIFIQWRFIHYTSVEFLPVTP